MAKIRIPREKKLFNFDEEEFSYEDLFESDNNYNRRERIFHDEDDTDVVL